MQDILYIIEISRHKSLRTTHSPNTARKYRALTPVPRGQQYSANRETSTIEHSLRAGHTSTTRASEQLITAVPQTASCHHDTIHILCRLPRDPNTPDEGYHKDRYRQNKTRV